MNLLQKACRWGISLCLAVALGATTPAAWAAPNDPYRLGYGDSLNVTVVGQPTLTTLAQPVRPDGRITLPLVNDVAIQGKTVTEVTAALVRAYKPYLADPQIVVTVSKFRALQVTLLGQVNNPGTFNFEKVPTLVDALAAAGGLSDRASRGSIKVYSASGAFKTYDLDAVLSGKEKVPRLEEGAIVEVSEVWGPDWYKVAPVAASLVTATLLFLRAW